MTTIAPKITTTAAATISGVDQRRGSTVAGWVLTGLVGAFLAFDGINHVSLNATVRAGAADLGMDPDVFLPIGIIQLIFLALYLVPRTSVFGAVLLTAFLGGAVCSNVIAGNPFFGYVMSGVYTATAMWLGVWFRNPALRRLVPFRR